MSAVVDLRAEHRTEPIGVGVRRPRFSWRLTASGRAVRQESYRLIVTESAIGSAGPGRVVWDSGVVGSDRSIEVRYDAEPLRPAHRYDWTVTVTAGGARASAGSHFETALLAPEDWPPARWIAAGPGTRGGAEVGPAPALSTTFRPAREPVAARLYVAAGGYAEGRLNGARVGDAYLSPAFTDYTARVTYVVEDVTSLIEHGENTLALYLGRGFYGLTNPNAWGWEKAPWHGEPCVRAFLRVFDAGGGFEDVAVTGSHWWSAPTATLYDDLYAGETHDARRAGADAAPVEPAVEVDGPAGRLVAQAHQPIRVTETLAADEVTEPEPGVFVARFPRLVSGTAEVTVEGERGTEIELRYGEKLLADGRPNADAGLEYVAGGFQTDRLTLAGGGPETWHARFTYKGFQYVEVGGWPTGAVPATDRLRAHVLRTDVPRTGSFACSSALLNDIHAAVVNTIENNLHGLPTDTPTYEKNGWTGDGMLGAEMMLLNLDTHDLLAKWVDDIADSVDDSGRPQVIAPTPGWGEEFQPSPPWNAAYALVPWWLYLYRGDETVLRRHYAGMSRYVRHELAGADGGIVWSRLNDWVSPDTDAGGGEAPDDRRVSGTAYLYAMLDTMQRIACVLGEDGDRAAFRRQADGVRAAFNRTFYDPDLGHYRGDGDAGYRQTHNVLAVALGLAEPTVTPGVVRSIADDVRRRGTALNTGALGTKYLLPVLTRHGHADLAVELALRTEYPSWGRWLRDRTGTLWEHWKPGSRSRNHYFLGTIDDWLYHDVAGVRPASPGFRTVRIDPGLTEHLDWAEARVPTPYGAVDTRWERHDGGTTVTADVPVGVTAEITLRGAGPGQVTESGDPIDRASGVDVVSATGTSTRVRTGSGSYRFDVARRDT